MFFLFSFFAVGQQYSYVLMFFFFFCYSVVFGFPVKAFRFFFFFFLFLLCLSSVVSVRQIPFFFFSLFFYYCLLFFLFPFLSIFFLVSTCSLISLFMRFTCGFFFSSSWSTFDMVALFVDLWPWLFHLLFHEWKTGISLCAMIAELDYHGWCI